MKTSTYPLLWVLPCVAWASGAVAESTTAKPRPKVAFHLAEAKPGKGLREAAVLGSTAKVYLHKSAAVTGADIAAARVFTQGNGDRTQYGVEIRFTSDGARRMARLSKRRPGRILAILIEGKVVSAPRLNERVSETAIVLGSLTQAQAEKLAGDLNRGRR